MEMVEAIIDNNFDANMRTLSRATPADDDESDLQATTSLGASLSPAPQLSPDAQSEKLQSKGDARSGNQGIAPAALESEKGAKRQLKRRKKFLVGDLSCMKADFVPAPRIANANIKYVR